VTSAARLVAIVRLIHPAPAGAVVGLSAVLAAIIGLQVGAPGWRIALVVLAVAGSQIATGAMNDWADRDRDLAARPEKPIPNGELTPGTALEVAGLGIALQLAASIPLGPLPTLLGAVAVASALLYDLWLSRTPLSVLPYLVSFGVLPAWIASGVGAPLERVLPVIPLVAPFAVAAHLANTLRDWDADAAYGSRSLAQVIGRPASLALALVLAIGVGMVVAAVLAASGRLGPIAGVLGVIGLVAVTQGIRGARALWYGILLAAVAWSAAWALVG
jgi:4-hydroxybenzoate polyprenyltransferase